MDRKIDFVKTRAGETHVLHLYAPGSEHKQKLTHVQSFASYTAAIEFADNYQKTLAPWNYVVITNEKAISIGGCTI